LVVDLGSSESIKVLTDYLNANEQLDGIVVAAGRVGFGMAADTSAQQVASLTQVNFGGPAQLITELLPALRGREDAFIAAITGVVAEKSFPGMSAYCASKSAFSAWLGSLAFELRRDKIKVIDARPGHTETGLATRPMFGAAPQMPQGMTAEHVAGVVVAAISAGTTVLASTDF
jgi:cyclic-di-GMP-binding biofilm dispersal mediator protein